jgi:hypothetical protein
VIVPAHVGHWLVDLLYVAPLIVIAGLLLVGKLRDRRAERERRSRGLPP